MAELLSSPLKGRTLILACSPGKVQRLAAGLESLGARIIPFPTIEIRAAVDKKKAAAVLGGLHRYDWVVFTSAHGVEYFLRCLGGERLLPSRRQGLRVCAIGPATARAARDAGFRVALVAEEHSAEGVLQALRAASRKTGGLSGLRMLLPRAKEGRDLLPRELEAAGAIVQVLACYETTVHAASERDVLTLTRSRADMIVFTSPSTVYGWIRILGPEAGLSMMRSAAVAVLGPVTAAAVEAQGISAAVRPQSNSIESLTEAIEDFYSSGFGVRGEPAGR